MKELSLRDDSSFLRDKLEFIALFVTHRRGGYHPPVLGIVTVFRADHIRPYGL